MTPAEQANLDLLRVNLDGIFGEDTIAYRGETVLSVDSFRASWDYISVVSDFASVGELGMRAAEITFARPDLSSFPARGDKFINEAGETFTVKEIGEYDNVTVTLTAVIETVVSAGHLKGK